MVIAGPKLIYGEILLRAVVDRGLHKRVGLNG